MEDVTGPPGRDDGSVAAEPEPAEADATEPGPAEPDATEPDDKDWTWTASRRCPDCGLDAGAVPTSGIGAALRLTTPRWEAVLRRESVAARPAPAVWSPLEYACHVRDVHRLFAARTSSMLDQDGPRFANWDQDETAVRERYWAQEPAAVSRELADAADIAAAVFDGVPDGAWDRRGVRSNGSEFTVASIGRYYLHDVVHHLHDVDG